MSRPSRSFGGVSASILYDNTSIAVAKILGDGTRKRTRTFSELQLHYLFDDRFGRPGKGNDKGNLEGMIGVGRGNFLVPMPRFESFEALNTWLEEQCTKRQDAVLRGQGETIGERLMRDLDALIPLPTVPYDACEKVSTRATSISMVRYRDNYSVPVAYAHHEVQVRGYVGEVVIGCGAEIIARHCRSYEKADMVFDPMHFLPLLEQKGEPLERHWSEGQWRTPWIRRHRSKVGICRRSSPRCTDFWKRGWARRESGNTCRFRACWRPSRWPMSTAPCARSRRDRLRRGQAPCPVPRRAAPAEARSRHLSLPASRPGRDHEAGQLHEPDVRDGAMNDTPQVLLQHHLKKLRLPTFNSEYAKLARQCAAEGKDHVQYLLRLCELELIERERRMIERRSSSWSTRADQMVRGII